MYPDSTCCFPRLHLAWARPTSEPVAGERHSPAAPTLTNAAQVLQTPPPPQRRPRGAKTAPRALHGRSSALAGPRRCGKNAAVLTSIDLPSAALLGACAVLLGCAGAAGPSDGARAPSSEGAELETAAPAPLELALLSFNIRYENDIDGENGWDHRRDMVVAVIESEAADVVGLQEAERAQLDDIGPPAPYAEIGIGREAGGDGGEYTAILYRKGRFEVDESGTFWLSPTPEEPGSTGFGNRVPRICTWARLVERDSGRAFYVFNTHLDHESQPARARGAELIAARIAARAHPDPVFVMGDLNAGESNAAVRYLTGAAARASDGVEPVAPSPALADSFRLVHPDAAEAGTFNAWTGVSTGDKIDYILVPRSDSVEVVEAAILRTSEAGRYPSDHFPVSARVVLR